MAQHTKNYNFHKYSYMKIKWINEWMDEQMDGWTDNLIDNGFVNFSFSENILGHLVAIL